eukprot:m.105011 g.105011  ORF g.105011 m.105011 type:complete len:2254 (-) comp12628_c0_seq1:1186-7947(-)
MRAVGRALCVAALSVLGTIISAQTGAPTLPQCLRNGVISTGFGNCQSYIRGGDNFNHCHEDEDQLVSPPIVANLICPECELCVCTGCTRAPTPPEPPGSGCGSGTTGSGAGSGSPSCSPTGAQLDVPTQAPTEAPFPPVVTGEPTATPTATPVFLSDSPSFVPTAAPVTVSDSPSLVPTATPVALSDSPSRAPSTSEPSLMPSGAPTASEAPTAAPIRSTDTPTAAPLSNVPSLVPTNFQSAAPTASSTPTNVPSQAPTVAPTSQPTVAPSSETPTSVQPTLSPSGVPTSTPSGSPTSFCWNRCIEVSLYSNTSSCGPLDQVNGIYRVAPRLISEGTVIWENTERPQFVWQYTRVSNTWSLIQRNSTSHAGIVRNGEQLGTVIGFRPPTVCNPALGSISTRGCHPNARLDPAICITNGPTSVPSGGPTDEPSAAPTRRPSTPQPSTQPTAIPTAMPTLSPTPAQTTFAPSTTPTHAPSTTCLAIDPEGCMFTAWERNCSGAIGVVSSLGDCPRTNSSRTEWNTNGINVTYVNSPCFFLESIRNVCPQRCRDLCVSTAQGSNNGSQIAQCINLYESRCSHAPTPAPVEAPTPLPSQLPSASPSESPSRVPSVSPSLAPTQTPTTLMPTPSPTLVPVSGPTNTPSTHPTGQPTEQPTERPSSSPTELPTLSPTSFCGRVADPVSCATILEDLSCSAPAVALECPVRCNACPTPAPTAPPTVSPTPVLLCNGVPDPDFCLQAQHLCDVGTINSACPATCGHVPGVCTPSTTVTTTATTSITTTATSTATTTPTSTSSTTTTTTTQTVTSSTITTTTVTSTSSTVTSTTLVPSTAQVVYNGTNRRVEVDVTVVTATGSPGSFATVFVEVVSGVGAGTSYGGFRTSGTGMMRMTFVPSGLGEIGVLLSVYFAGPSIRPPTLAADVRLHRYVSIAGADPCTDNTLNLPHDWRAISGISCNSSFLGLCASSVSMLGYGAFRDTCRILCGECSPITLTAAPTPPPTVEPIGSGESGGAPQLPLASRDERIPSLPLCPTTAGDRCVCHHGAFTETVVFWEEVLQPFLCGTQCRSGSGSCIFYDAHCDGNACHAAGDCVASSFVSSDETCPSGATLCTSVVNTTVLGCADVNECPSTVFNPDPVPSLLCTDAHTGCVNTIGSFTCNCTPGWAPNANGACVNVNECISNPSDLCPSVGSSCRDTLGSFECLCPSGFDVLGNRCIDQLECRVSGRCDPATSVCIETFGSFSCDCFDGYTVDSTSQCVELDECSHAQTNNCASNARCTNTVGSFTCSCDLGYLGDGTTCADVDECTSGSHNCDGSATCTNIDGSFICACANNYFGNSTHCQQCSPDSTSCVCDVGYSGNGIVCTNVDECILGVDDCSLARSERCIDTPGSFLCCSSGRDSVNVQGFLRCGDVNECTNSQSPFTDGTSHCAQQSLNCSNTDGSFLCCSPGFGAASAVAQSCTDVDECAVAPQLCPHPSTCTNTVGSFLCCGVGFSHQNDNLLSCVDVDECASAVHDCDVSATCINTVSSFHCSCNPGFTGNGSVCGNVDECASSIDNCANVSTCMDTTGSFNCIPNTGYTGSGVFPSDIDECSTLQPCVNMSCTNTVGSFSCCNLGFAVLTGSLACQNVDECISSPCSGNSTCFDTNGSFVCCSPGFEVSSSSGDFSSGSGDFSNPTGSSEEVCSNIDECARGGTECQVNSHCEDSDGSFTCACNAGYAASGLSCLDINECTGTNWDTCSISGYISGCTNTDGSYICDARSADMDECSMGTAACGALQNCHNVPGSFECPCMAGFEMNNNVSDCVNINECDETTTCRPWEQCTDTIGSFSCATVIISTGSPTISPTADQIDSATSGTSNGGSDTLPILRIIMIVVICALVVLAVVLVVRRRSRRKRGGATLSQQGFSGQGHTVNPAFIQPTRSVHASPGNETRSVSTGGIAPLAVVTTRTAPANVDMHVRGQDSAASCTRDDFYAIRNHVGLDEVHGPLKADVLLLHRYDNVRPKRSTQVQLTKTTRPKDGTRSDKLDFVNANYIPLLSTTDRRGVFIAAQSPTQAGVGHFWRMVVETGSSIVVQLTPPGNPSGIELCAEYYPASRADPGVFAGGCKITYGGRAPTLAIRSITESVLGVTSINGTSRTVAHFCAFVAWPHRQQNPDHDVIIAMAEEIVARLNRIGGPVIVHCDSGVGRTSVFLGLCLGIHALQTVGRCSTTEIIEHMRGGRNGMVVSHEECQLLHTLIAEHSRRALSPVPLTHESRL